MKICDNCGGLNYTVKTEKGKRVCYHCGKVMSDRPQCKPTRHNDGDQPKQGETGILLDDVTPFEHD